MLKKQVELDREARKKYLEEHGQPVIEFTLNDENNFETNLKIKKGE